MKGKTVTKAELIAIVTSQVDNVPLQFTLLDAIVSGLPETYARVYIENQYYTKYYKGTYYTARHYIVSSDYYYFKTEEEAYNFIKSVEINPDKEITESIFRTRVKRKKLLCGYVVEKHINI